MLESEHANSIDFESGLNNLHPGCDLDILNLVPVAEGKNRLGCVSIPFFVDMAGLLAQ